MGTSEMPILVTGATGRVGAEVVQGLLREGLRVRALVRDPSRAKPLAAAGAELSEGDFRRPDTLQRALAGVERAFLASADAQEQEQMECTFLEEARRAGVRHVVKLSAHSAGLPIPVSFGAVHRRIEQALERSGLRYTVLRPTFFMQSVLLFAADVRRRGGFATPMRQGRISMVDCRDVADVAVRCLRGPDFEGRILTLTGPQAHSFPEVAALLSGVCGRPVRFTRLPFPVARLLLPFVSGMPRWQSNLVVDLFRALEQGAQEHPTPDVQEVTGRSPRPLTTFLQEHAAHFGAAGAGA